MIKKQSTKQIAQLGIIISLFLAILFMYITNKNNVSVKTPDQMSTILAHPDFHSQSIFKEVINNRVLARPTIVVGTNRLKKI